MHLICCFRGRDIQWPLNSNQQRLLPLSLHLKPVYRMICRRIDFSYTSLRRSDRNRVSLYRYAENYDGSTQNFSKSDDDVDICVSFLCFFLFFCFVKKRVLYQYIKGCSSQVSQKSMTPESKEQKVYEKTPHTTTGQSI